MNGIEQWAKGHVKDFLHMTYFGSVLKSHMKPAAPFAPHNKITIILNAKAREAKVHHQHRLLRQPNTVLEEIYIPLNFIMLYAICFAGKKVHFVNLLL